MGPMLRVFACTGVFLLWQEANTITTNKATKRWGLKIIISLIKLKRKILSDKLQM